MRKSHSLLIDTQIFIWFLGNDTQRLRKEAFTLLSNPANRIYVSVVSIWEMILKTEKGKLRTPPNVKQALEVSGFSPLYLSLDHVLQLRTLEKIHQDPFDRMLVAQAMVEKLTLVTTDRIIWKYRVATMKVNHRD